MYRIFWVITALMVCSHVGQTAVVKYTECPEGCQCEIKSGITVMSCKTLLKEGTLINIPVIHFELIDSEQPLDISSSAFDNPALKHVNSITIFNSSVLSIDKSSFSKLLELTFLKISHSNLSYIYPETFQNNANLINLNLTGNPLKIDTFLSSNSIEELDLSYCNISEIGQRSFKNMSQLVFLDLSHNKINTLHSKAFSTLRDLQELSLAHNNLTEITKDIFTNNKKLEVLDLSNNPLISVSDFNLPNLQTLKLHSCMIKEIGNGIFKNMHYLSTLDISNNNMINIDLHAFTPAKQLTTIYLSGNDLHNSGESLFVNNNKLEKVVLDNNNQMNEFLVRSFKTHSKYFNIHYFSCNHCGLNLMPVEVFANMPAAVTVLLSHNKITDISTGVFKYLSHLVVLDLSYNDIHTISDDTFVKNINLNKIILSGNPLASMHAKIFENNKNLEYLDLSNCNLYKMWTAPPGPIKLNSIASLNVSSNKINIIDYKEVSIVTNLKVLDISQNPLSCSNELKMLIQYLQTHGVANGNYLTHDKQMFDIELKQTNTTSWREIAREHCPDMFMLDNDDDDDDGDDDDDDVDENDDDDGSYYDDDENDDDGIIQDKDYFTELVTNDVDTLFIDVQGVQQKTKDRNMRNLYMWPVLVFLGTCLLVLAIVVNTVLFVIRKRQMFSTQRINIKTISRLKKNSGFVYQQLSEEKKQQNPIFSKFSLIPNNSKTNL